MSVADVVEAIGLGTRRGPEAEEALHRGEERENPDDAVQLSLGMAMAIHFRGKTPRVFEDALDLAGRILCPLFDYAKPAEYRSQMRRVRLQHRGIAHDFKLQREWFEKTTPLVSDGALESVQAAVEAEVWRRLAWDSGASA